MVDKILYQMYVIFLDTSLLYRKPLKSGLISFSKGRTVTEINKSRVVLLFPFPKTASPKLCIPFSTKIRFSITIPSGILHQKYECGRNAGQRGSWRLPRGGEKCVAARASECHKHHVGPRQGWQGSAPYQWHEGGVSRPLSCCLQYEFLNMVILSYWL